jgi:hypothetical protein
MYQALELCWSPKSNKRPLPILEFQSLVVAPCPCLSWCYLLSIILVTGLSFLYFIFFLFFLKCATQQFPIPCSHFPCSASATTCQAQAGLRSAICHVLPSLLAPLCPADRQTTKSSAYCATQRTSMIDALCTGISMHCALGYRCSL